MELHKHTHPDALARYAFLWSELRLLIASVALFMGGIPPLIYIFPSLGLAVALLKIGWIISGVASAYLLYRWYTGGQKIFGTHNRRDHIAFFVMLVSGLNLGLVGLIGQNIGMSISSSYAVFVLVGIAYLAAAYHLYTRWRAHGERLF